MKRTGTILPKPDSTVLEFIQSTFFVHSHAETMLETLHVPVVAVMIHVSIALRTPVPSPEYLHRVDRLEVMRTWTAVEATLILLNLDHRLARPLFRARRKLRRR